MNNGNMGGRDRKGTDAIELAILNGIEAYNREQAQKADKKNAGNANKPKNGAQNTNAKKKSLGEEHTAEAMQEAGFQPRRRSRAKGKGTKINVPAQDSRPAHEKQDKKAVETKNNGERNKKSKAPLAENVQRAPKGKKKKPLKVLFFGGVGEIGKNMTALEYGNDIIIIDAGIIFPTEEMPGIDLVFPDITYLVQNRQKVRGVFLTHGHEDHIGGVPYLLKELNVPVYGTKLTLALVDNKLREHRLNNVTERTVSPKDKVKAGVFTVNFVNVNHSIAGAMALAIETPYGIVFHSGDF